MVVPGKASAALNFAKANRRAHPDSTIQGIAPGTLAADDGENGDDDGDDGDDAEHDEGGRVHAADGRSP